MLHSTFFSSNKDNASSVTRHHQPSSVISHPSQVITQGENSPPPRSLFPPIPLTHCSRRWGSHEAAKGPYIGAKIEEKEGKNEQGSKRGRDWSGILNPPNGVIITDGGKGKNGWGCWLTGVAGCVDRDGNDAGAGAGAVAGADAGVGTCVLLMRTMMMLVLTMQKTTTYWSVEGCEGW